MTVKSIDIKKFENLLANSSAGTLSITQPPTSISFLPKSSGEDPLMLLEGNGDIYVKGKLVENDVEVVDGMRLLVTHYGYQGLKNENERLKKEVEELREYKFKYEQLCR